MCVHMSAVCGFPWGFHSDGLHNTRFTEHLEGNYLQDVTLEERAAGKSLWNLKPRWEQAEAMG